MRFEVVGKTKQIESIAIGRGINEIKRPKRLFGGTKWRKLKGIAKVKLQNGNIRLAELHWYEAHGIGKRKIKIKKLLD